MADDRSRGTIAVALGLALALCLAGPDGKADDRDAQALAGETAQQIAEALGKGQGAQKTTERILREYPRNGSENLVRGLARILGGAGKLQGRFEKLSKKPQVQVSELAGPQDEYDKLAKDWSAMVRKYCGWYQPWRISMSNISYTGGDDLCADVNAVAIGVKWKF